MSTKKVVFSGIQPSGKLHIGNYLGAIKQYEELQHQHECFFSIVDLHAMTVSYDFTSMAEHTKNTAAMYIAAGIDPAKVNIFIQSQVAAHAEMSWLLSCFINLGYLNRMVHFKQKAGSDRECSSLGLYSYPCLMAADILLYAADIVPVGEDQTQHLELTIDIAQRINHLQNYSLLKIPKLLLCKPVSRIMSLRDASQKMSKTNVSDYTRINLDDDNDVIALKIKKAKTDSQSFSSNMKELQNRPEINNLSNIYLGFASEIHKIDLIKKFAGKSLSFFKKELTDLVIAKLEPVRTKYIHITKDANYIHTILKQGQERAHSTAQATLIKVKTVLGLYI